MAQRWKWKRVSVPIPDDLRRIAAAERRSISNMAEVALQEYILQWRAAVPPQDQAQGSVSVKRDG
jgi:hypothetical protein